MRRIKTTKIPSFFLLLVCSRFARERGREREREIERKRECVLRFANEQNFFYFFTRARKCCAFWEGKNNVVLGSANAHEPKKKTKKNASG